MFKKVISKTAFIALCRRLLFPFNEYYSVQKEELYFRVLLINIDFLMILRCRYSIW